MNQPLFAWARQEIPTQDPAWKFRALAGPTMVRLGVIPPAGVTSNAVARWLFLPSQPNLVKYGGQSWSRAGGEYWLDMELLSGRQPVPARLQGVLALPRDIGNRVRPLEVDVALAVSTAGQ